MYEVIYTLALFLISSLPLRSQCLQQIAAGTSHSVALKADGTLWAWGFNGSGQIGDGTSKEKVFPVKVGNDNHWKTVATGGNHTLAIKSDGTLWVWGDNLWGQIGNGTTSQNVNVPTQIGSATDWETVYGGDGYSLARKKNGTLWGWGDNDYGQLGFSGPAPRNRCPAQLQHSSV